MKRELLAGIIKKLMNIDLNISDEEKLAFIGKLVEEAYFYGYQDGEDSVFESIDNW